MPWKDTIDETVRPSSRGVDVDIGLLVGGSGLQMRCQRCLADGRGQQTGQLSRKQVELLQLTAYDSYHLFFFSFKSVNHGPAKSPFHMSDKRADADADSAGAGGVSGVPPAIPLHASRLPSGYFPTKVLGDSSAVDWHVFDRVPRSFFVSVSLSPCRPSHPPPVTPTVFSIDIGGKTWGHRVHNNGRSQINGLFDSHWTFGRQSKPTAVPLHTGNASPSYRHSEHRV